MGSNSHLVLILEIDAGGDPISGRVRDDARSMEEEFGGWLGLAKALERMLEAKPPPSHGGPATDLH